jgi:hypothetical protein
MANRRGQLCLEARPLIGSLAPGDKL